MLIAVEAEIDTNGIITLLEPVIVKRKTRAVLTLLDAQSAAKTELSEEEKQLRETNFASWIGAGNSGNSNSADNEQIDADLAREYGKGL